ncbi:DUF72 domain-containing protein [Pontibacillus marinus]|uniref:DUF72 domain-containing protein n=1 Tax=Pontibacillus marinus BH030004 = DSM 16465 TaxID=1385511 RepID=A0A0A5FTR5_9BACI|nr:DUF72 domain-containing protein [Pontibacillus marinus]KGX83304.1 hypothetical protein N783_04665 [Pontibacillus marinus BH030004 = DSM 16465]
MSISIGLTGWGDHAKLYDASVSPQDKLSVYASHFPVVEVDSAFYAIQPQRNYEKWVRETPDSFSFVIKAYNKMTGHHREKLTSDEVKEMFQAYKDSIQPVIEAGKLKCVLFQFPPWFNVSKENVQKLRVIRKLMGDLPLALEFRNRTWFLPEYKEQTLKFMREENWIHSICDEPQAGEGSVPRILEPTHPEKTLVRFHGRNTHGWNKNGREDWREVRFLYNYNEEELREWKERVLELQQITPDITILFNNNSGGDAAPNAKTFIDMLGISYCDLNPRQMDLFD